MSIPQGSIQTTCATCGGLAHAVRDIFGQYPGDQGWHHFDDEDWRSNPHAVVPRPEHVRMHAAAINAYWWRIWARPKVTAQRERNQ